MAESEDPDATFVPSIDWPLYVTLKEARSWWMLCLPFKFSRMSRDFLLSSHPGDFWHTPAACRQEQRTYCKRTQMLS